MSGMSRISYETYLSFAGLAYLCLATNLMLVVAALPLVVLLLTTDPARSWPLLAALAPLCGPAVAGAFAVFTDHAEGGVTVVRSFWRGWRCNWIRSLALAGLVTAIAVVSLVDVRALAGSALGVAVIPALLVIPVLASAVGLVALVALVEVPSVALIKAVRVSGYLALRRWPIILLALAALATQGLVLTTMPAIALGLTAAPVLYVAWANGRHALRPALEASATTA